MYNGNETQVAIMKDMMAYIQLSLQSGRISFEEAVETLRRDIEQVYGDDMTSPSLMTAGYYKSLEDIEREKAQPSKGRLNDSMLLVTLPMGVEYPKVLWGEYNKAQAALYGTLCELSSRNLAIPGYLGACRVLVVPNEEAMDYLEEQIDFARGTDCIDNLADRLFWLVQNGGSRPVRVVLCRDFAPHSFVFAVQRVDDTGQRWERCMNGGLIYSGPDQPLDGSAPAFTVSLGEPKIGWSIHT